MGCKLSPGWRWKDKLALKSLDEVLAWRKWWIRRGQENRRVREALIETCRYDLLFYVNLFVWQYNPRDIGNEVGPFWTWDFQDRDFRDMVTCVEDQVNLVSEKSRDMGFSWSYDILGDWLCRFHERKKVLMISKSEKAVESADPDSLFWKIDFMHQNLPEWLHEPDKFARQKMFFGYPNGSTLTGEASTGRAGVGGRATMIFVDEFSQIKEDWEVLHRTSDTSYCRMFNGTHLGTGTAFYRLCTDRKAFPSTRWRHIVRHWSEHPKKRPGLYRFDQARNQVEVLDKEHVYPRDFEFTRSPAPVGGPFPGLRSPWYDAACGDKGSMRAIAMDLDINPQGSVSQVFDPLIIARLNAEYCRAPYWQGDLEYDEETGKPLRLVRNPNGLLKLWCLPRGNDKIPPGRYKVGCDLSAGTGATNSCVTIIDARLGEKVASLATPNMKPDKFAVLVVALCLLFEDAEGYGAELVWECPGPGLIFSEVVLKLGYRHIYYRTQEERSGPRLMKRERQEQPGWYQSNDGKRWLIDRYMAALQNERYITREREELEEALKFRWTNDGRSVEHTEERSDDDPSGARLNHGDRVIGAALAWMLAAEVEQVREPEQEEQAIPVNSIAYRRSLQDDKMRELGEEPTDDWLRGGYEYGFSS